MKIISVKAGTLFFLGFVAIFLCFGLFGCAEPIVKVDKMAYCDDNLDHQLLTEPCTNSVPLPAGSTYQIGLDGKRQGDSALDQCAAKTAKLQQAMAVCHAAAARYNSAIDALNKTQ